MDAKTEANTNETVPAKTLEELALELAKVGDELTHKYDPQYKEHLHSAATNLIVTIGQEVVFFLIRNGAIWKVRRTESFTEMSWNELRGLLATRKSNCPTAIEFVKIQFPQLENS